MITKYISEQERLADADLNTICFSVDRGRKRNLIKFQRHWLHNYKWLHYGIDEVCQGDWCLLCILFLSHSERVV